MSTFLKIVERKGQLGLHLINQEGEFFLFGKALIAMWRNRGEYVMVKHHNADIKNVIGYHPGQIVGLIVEGTEGITVRIYKGGVGKSIGRDDGKSLTNVVQREGYIFSATDFEAVVAAFEVHYKNNAGFEEMLLVGAPMVFSDC